jgi:ABC-type ATPase with predicted acetyltransferase domain
MQDFDIVVESDIKETYRVAKIRGMFDMHDPVKEQFVGALSIPNEWNIGVIVGHSGTGKTTIANNLFGDKFIKPEYNSDSVIDDMPGDDIDVITRTFNSVGFSSPPSWLKPYSVLSNGEKMRVDLAYAILTKNEMFIFDEFTSVVDREVAKIGSTAMQKAIRSQGKQFIAVTCHEDILDWLEPDWVFDTNEMKMAEKKTTNDQKSKYKFTSQKDIGLCLASITI